MALLPLTCIVGLTLAVNLDSAAVNLACLLARGQPDPPPHQSKNNTAQYARYFAKIARIPQIFTHLLTFHKSTGMLDTDKIKYTDPR